jgi:tripartite-type tricarboxylate transporter receptor subunit TctC
MNKTTIGRLLTATCVAAALTLSAPVSAQTKYPLDKILLITHSSPGGGTDVYLREMAGYIAKAMGVDIAVENVRGGSGAKAIAKLATSPADGSIFYGATPTYINMSLLAKPEYTYANTEPVVNFFLDPQVIYVRKDSPLNSFSDVIAAAKANPGKQKWGTGTPASLERQALEKFKKLAGVDVGIITHDGGGDMMINVLNGTLELGIGEIQEIKGQLDAGELRIIGTFTKDRLEDYPDVGTAREAGVDMVVNKFRGLVGPKGLPADVIKAWEEAIPKVMADPDFKKWYRNAALVPTFMTHAEFVPFVDDVVAEQAAFFKEYGVTKD